jgi:hypothetical protein
MNEAIKDPYTNEPLDDESNEPDDSGFTDPLMNDPSLDKRIRKYLGGPDAYTELEQRAMCNKEYLYPKLRVHNVRLPERRPRLKASVLAVLKVKPPVSS